MQVTRAAYILHIIDQALQKKIFLPSVAFDQHLRIKLVETVRAKGLKIVTHLVGFHTVMSFIESVGITMEGSGLKKALKTVYGQIL